MDLVLLQMCLMLWQCGTSNVLVINICLHAHSTMSQCKCTWLCSCNNFLGTCTQCTMHLGGGLCTVVPFAIKVVSFQMSCTLFTWSLVTGLFNAMLPLITIFRSHHDCAPVIFNDETACLASLTCSLVWHFMCSATVS